MAAKPDAFDEASRQYPAVFVATALDVFHKMSGQFPDIFDGTSGRFPAVLVATKLDIFDIF